MIGTTQGRMMETRRDVMAVAGVMVTRVVVPLWLASGALLKLVDASPTHLPPILIEVLGALGVDLMFVVRYSIAVELVVVGVIWILPGIARAIAIAMLTAFVPILVGDIVMGAASCGCFGAVEVNPWVTLAMDGTLLAGVLFLGARAPSLELARRLPTGRTVVAGLWSLAAVAVAFGLTTGALPDDEAGSGEDPDATATPAPAPPEYFVPKYESWIGTPWSEVPLARFVRGMPEDLDQGRQYIVFYRKDCEHCHELLELFFSEELPAPTTVVAVPERAGFPTEGVVEMPCDACREARLPAGCDWFMMTPVMARLEDGVVACAAEVSADDPVCLQW